MTVADARIRLEGQLELLEAIVAHLDNVHGALKTSDWRVRFRDVAADVEAVGAAWEYHVDA